jgi:hypothetical protein
MDVAPAAAKVAVTSLRAEQTRKVVAARRGFAFLATSVSASPAPVEKPVCKGGARGFAQDRGARPSLAPRFAQDRQPRRGCDRGDTGWLDQGDRMLLQRSSQTSSKIREIDGSLIVRILRYCSGAIDLGRMRTRLWLKAVGVLCGSGFAHSVLRRGWMSPRAGRFEITPPTRGSIANGPGSLRLTKLGSGQSGRTCRAVVGRGGARPVGCANGLLGYGSAGCGASRTDLTML